MNIGVIIPAAGSGQRMGGVNKAFLELNGQPMLKYSVDVFLAHPDVHTVVIALSGDAPSWLNDARVQVVKGGAERADSVRNGLAAMSSDIDAVIVHDAARPLITIDMIDRVVGPVRSGDSATIAVPMSDTIHEVDGEHHITNTPDRSKYWRAQTPQAFPRAALESAFTNATAGGTDEAGMVAAAGSRVVVVPGEAWNIKVTTPEDVAIAEATLRSR